MEFIGVISFVVVVVLTFALAKDNTNLKKENQQLHKDLDFVLQHVPAAGVEELEQIKMEYLNEEEI